MKKSFFLFASLLMLGAAVTFFGCKKDKDDEPENGGDNPKTLADKLKGKYFYGYAYYAENKRWGQGEYQIHFLKSGNSAVIEATGEEILTITWSAENDEITISNNAQEIFNKDLKAELSADGKVLKISNIHTRWQDPGEDYLTLVLNVSDKSRNEIISEFLISKNWESDPDYEANYQNNGLPAGGITKVVFTADHKGVITRADEYPMNFNWQYEANGSDLGSGWIKMTPIKDEKWTEADEYESYTTLTKGWVGDIEDLGTEDEKDIELEIYYQVRDKQVYTDLHQK